MADNPEMYRQLERRDRTLVRWTVVGVFLVALVAASYGYFLWKIDQVTAQHSSDIAQIDRLSKEIALRQSQHEQTNQQILSLTRQIAADRTAIAQGTAEGLADYQAICDAVPNCTLPYPSP